MIHKLTEEKACAVQQSQKLRQELVSDLLVLLFYKESNTYIYIYIYGCCIQEMLRRESSNKQSGGGHSLVLMLLVGLLGCVIGYILNVRT